MSSSRCKFNVGFKHYGIFGGKDQVLLVRRGQGKVLDIAVLNVALCASGECVSREPDQGTREWADIGKETLTFDSKH